MKPLIDDIPSKLRYSYYGSSWSVEINNHSYYSEPLIVRDNAEYTILPETSPGKIQFIISYYQDYSPFINTKNMYTQLMLNLFSRDMGYDRGLDIIAHNRGLFTCKYSESITNDDECVPDLEGIKLKWAPNLSKLKLLFQLGFKKDNPLIKKCHTRDNYIDKVQYEYWEKIYKSRKPPIGTWIYALDGTQKLLEPFSPVLFVDFSIFVEPQSDFVDFEILYRRLVNLCKRQGIEIIIVDDLMDMFYEHIPRTYDSIIEYFIPFFDPDGEINTAVEEEINF